MQLYIDVRKFHKTGAHASTVVALHTPVQIVGEYGTDVHTPIQTVIQTIVKNGTDVQTVDD